MKILLVNKFLYPNGGSETYIFKLGEQLVSMGHDVQYFGMEHEKRIVGNRAESYTSNMDFHTSKFKKLLYPFKIIYSMEARVKIRAVLDDFAPDVVHLNNFNFQLTPSVIYEIKKYEKALGRHIPIIYTAHDYQWICPNHMLYIPEKDKLCTACVGGAFFQCTKNRCIHNSWIKSLLGSMEGSIYKWLKTYRYVDAIICPSEFMNRMLSLNPLLASKTVTMHNFITDSGFWENKNDKNDFVLYFGRYSKEKGIETLLQVCEKMPNIRFVFAGSGPIDIKGRDLPNVEDRGFLEREELSTLISAASLVVFPSEWYENCPFSVMEAQQAGVPVIATNLGGTPELVGDKRTGELVEARNPNMLAAAVEMLWEDKEKTHRYAEGCRNNEFEDVSVYTKKLIELYTRYTNAV